MGDPRNGGRVGGWEGGRVKRTGWEGKEDRVEKGD
jgi:hypothetical protein